MEISLMGYMGSGKSTIGAKLADKLKLEFIDLDNVIEQNQEKTIADIFSEQGQIKFRKLEQLHLNQILEQKDNFVLALGGGTPAYYDNLEKINKYTQSIFLRANLSTLLNRLENQKDNRPLLSHLDPDELPEFLAKHLFERRDFYEKAKIVIDTEKKNIEELIDEINSRLQTI